MTFPLSGLVEGQPGAFLNWYALNANLASFQGTSPASFMGAGTHEYYVAASNAPAAWKSLAGPASTCDGVNDQSEIQAAINAAAILGGVVILSPGQFNVSGSIQMLSHTTLRGQGMKSTFITATTGLAFGVVFAIGTSSIQIRYWQVENLQLDSGGFASTPNMFCLWANTAWIDKVQFHGAVSAGITGSAFWDSVIMRCRFDGVGSKMAANQGAATGAITLLSTGVGDNNNNLHIVFNWFENTSSAPGDQFIYQKSGTAASEQDNKLRISNNKFEMHTVGNVPLCYFEKLQNSYFTDNIVLFGDYNPANGAPVAQPAWSFKSCNGINIKGLIDESQVNAATDSVDSFIQLDGCTNVSISGWTFSDQPSNFPQTAVLKLLNTNKYVTISDAEWQFNGNSVANGGTGTVFQSGTITQGSGGRRTARLTADNSAIVSNTTVADTGLAIDVLPGRNIRVDFLLVFSSSIAAGLKLALALPTGSTFDGSIMGPGAPVGTYWDGSAIALAGAGVAVKNTVRVTGLVTVPAAQNALGTVKVQAAQQTSDATNTVVRKGTIMFGEA